jgi:hypothetical protein
MPLLAILIKISIERARFTSPQLQNFAKICETLELLAFLAVVGRGVLERAVSIPYLFVMFFTAWIFSIRIGISLWAI